MQIYTFFLRYTRFARYDKRCAFICHMQFASTQWPHLRLFMRLLSTVWYTRDTIKTDSVPSEYHDILQCAPNVPKTRTGGAKMAKNAPSGTNNRTVGAL